MDFKKPNQTSVSSLTPLTFLVTLQGAPGASSHGYILENPLATP